MFFSLTSQFFLEYKPEELCFGYCPCSKTTHMTGTECLTESLKPCKFPFKANEKLYRKCTDDYNTEIKASDKRRFWCATEVDELNQMKKWSFCKKNACQTGLTII